MPGIFHGLGEICDLWLGVDANWEGKRSPRYGTDTTLRRFLRREGWCELLSGERLMWNLFSQILINWKRGTLHWWK